MEKKEKDELNYFEKTLVIVFLMMAILFAIGICFLEYYNQIKTIYFSLDDFEVTDREEKANVLQVSEAEDYFIIEGQVLVDLKSYKINIGIEDETGEMQMHKTHFFRPMHQFRGVIPKKDVSEEKTIYIVYMCNDEKILIKTHETVGGENE